MPFDIEKFKAERDAKNSNLRTNKYEILIPHCEAMLNNNNDLPARDLSFWVSGIQLPGYQTLTHNVRRYGYGPNETRPFASNFQQLQFQVDNDGEGKIYKHFNSWMQSIIPHDMETIEDTSTHGNRNKVYTVEYPDKYAVDFNIKVYDESGKDVYDVRVRRAYPVNLNSIPMQWGEQNQIMRFEVFMDFSDWKYV